MSTMDLTTGWTTAAPAVSAAFLASLVEVVEAFTIVLAVATVRGWRPASLGALAGLALLAVIVAAFGPLLGLVPLKLLQFTVGTLLLLFGMRWLRKAILRGAGVIALHDEALAFAAETAELREHAHRRATRLDWFAGLASFKAVVLEGLEVVFIVIAVGAGHGLVVPASLGALAGEHAQVRGRRDAFRIRRVLGRRGPRHRVARRGPRHPGLRGSVPAERACRCRAGAPARRGGDAMSWMTDAWREVAGLFVDDGWLAAAILVVIAVAVIVALGLGASLAAGGVLLF